MNKNFSTFRKDIVSGDWVLIASGLQKKPTFFKEKRNKVSKKGCPFENPQESNKTQPLFWLPRPEARGSEREKLPSWFVQVIVNKYPFLIPHKICPTPLPDGSYKRMQGVGFQEVVISRDHDRSLGFMTSKEILSILQAYRSRYLVLKSEKCVEYILIFHNNGPSAGATVPHPHSQIVALPIIPLDVGRSLSGSARYFKEHKKCVHCVMLRQELREKKRIVYKNKDFVVLCPYASHVAFEMRLYPLRHSSNFEEISMGHLEGLAEAMRSVFSKIKNAMQNPDYNFFIHTSPVNPTSFRHYHWHLEIFPRTNIWGGVELGTGVEIVKIPPEDAASILRKAKIG